MKYDAFISYRHSPLDMEIAKKVHTGLETYHVPRAVQKKTGKKKIKRVFRDQEELPIGSDLNDNISSALAQSEYLIVICSPRTPESYWVCKEIESFIEMHDRDHVLAVLIEGEPDESFPPQLLTDEKGNPVEPLAADVRGETAADRNKKFKTEILRLAAPVLGCSYDDLKQRHRERIIRRTISIVSSAAAIVAIAGTAFGIYNANVAAKMKQLADEKAQLADEKSRLADEKTQLAEEILEEYTDKQRNQSRFYAEKSLSLFNDGYREDAALVAMAGLPSEDNDRPYVGETEYALSRALYAYSTTNDFYFDRVLPHDMKVFDVSVSDDRKYLIVTDTGANVYVWDTETWDLLCKIDAKVDKDNRAIAVNTANADETGIYVITGRGVTKYSFDGDVIFEYAGKGALSDYQIIDSCSISTKNKIAALISPESNETNDITGTMFLMNSKKNYVVDILDLQSGEIIQTFENPLDTEFGLEMTFSEDGSHLAVCHGGSFSKVPRAYITVFDIAAGTSSSTLLAEKDVTEICPLESGNFAVVSSISLSLIGDYPNANLELVAADGSSVLWKTPLDVDSNTFWASSTIIKNHTYTTDDRKCSDIVIAEGRMVFCFDEENGKQKSRVVLPDNVFSIIVFLNSPRGMAALGNGQIQTIDFSTGEFLDGLIETGKRISNIVGFGQTLVLKEYLGSSIYILTPHYAPDLNTIHEGDEELTVVGVSRNSEYIITKAWDSDEYVYFSNTGEELFRFGDMDYLLTDDDGERDGFHLILDDDVIRQINPITKEVRSYDFSDIKQYIHPTGGSFTRNGKYCVAWGNGFIAVLDTEKEECVYLNDSEELAGQKIGNVALSEDGRKLYVSATDTNLYRIDIATGDIHYYENDSLREVANAYQWKYLTISPDGSTLAMCCSDGKVRIIDEASGEVKDDFTLLTLTNLFIDFTGDGKYLISQGDDYTVKIRDIERSEHISSYDMGGLIDYIVEDEENGLLALDSGKLVVMLETSKYAVVADCVSNFGVTYCKGKKSFILSGYSNLYSIEYKDYKKLCEEARRQFGDAELSDEKKILYNVD